MAKRDDVIDWVEEDYLIDLNLNGIDDRYEPPGIDVSASAHELKLRIMNNHHASPLLSCGDLDALWEMAESSGDETACGSAPTPDQNVVEDIGEAMGIHYYDDEILNFGAKERSRDVHRWELDPASSEDFLARASTRQRRPPQG